MPSVVTKKQYVQPTSKGQVTLPVAIRRRLAINPNTLLDVSVQNNQIVLKPIRTAIETQQWETVVNFTEFLPKGMSLNELQHRLQIWTKSKKPSKN